MAITGLQNLATGGQFISKITEQIEEGVNLSSNPLALIDTYSALTPYSIAFGMYEQATIRHDSVVRVSNDIVDMEDYITTDISAMPLTVTLTGKIFLSLDEMHVARQTLVDLMDKRPPTSAIMPPYFQYQTLKRWQKYNQLLTFYDGEGYKDLIISTMVRKRNKNTGEGHYDLQITLTKVDADINKRKVNLDPEIDFNTSEPMGRQLESTDDKGITTEGISYFQA